ncbi:carbohydrate ABC transporter permease [Phototrophicus methaneseepsis]|nr:sugar ABC transporter permease [Phototrophicus methaneseepsis]
MESARGQTNSESRYQSTALFYSILFILIGVAILIVFALTVANHPAIQSILNWQPTEESPQQPSLILAFLDRFGIVLPLLIIGLGTIYISIGARLRSRQIGAAKWAQIVLMWSSIGAAILAILNSINLIQTILARDGTGFTLSEALPVLFLIGLAVLLFIGFMMISRILDTVFAGNEALLNSETRFAWNLLIPTLLIVIMVAARPLEQTFIRSLTDKRFAGREVPNFVGLDNYANLLGIRFDTVPCRIDDETGGCVVRDDGSIRWESIDRTLLEDGYRTLSNIPLPGGEVAQSLAISGLDRDFLQGIRTTLVFTLFSVSLELIIGLSMAMIVNSDFRGRGFMRAVMLVPWAIPTVISARLWELMLKDTSAGIVNKVLMDLHVISMPQAWLSDPSLQIPAAIMVDVWKTAPFMALLLLAGLQTIPKDLYEAASVDGASRVRTFFNITLPLLRPTIGVALVFRTLDALRVFDLFNVLFGRQQLSMATYNYETLVNNQQDGYASAVSMIIFVLISIFAFVYVRLLNVETDS